MNIKFGNVILEQSSVSPGLFDVVTLSVIEKGKMKGRSVRKVISHSVPLAFAATEAVYKKLEENSNTVEMSDFFTELRSAQQQFISALKKATNGD